jgi:hypothetical protein
MAQSFCRDGLTNSFNRFSTKQKTMKPTFTFLFTLVGLVLLAMDRILDKSMVVTFDQRLLAMVQKFPLLKLKDFNSALTILMIAVMVYLVYFDDYFPPEVRSVMKCGVLLTGGSRGTYCSDRRSPGCQ